MSTLRRKIGGVLVTQHPGYLLELPDGGSDLDRCERLARQAREAQTPEAASDLFGQALAQWRGEPLDGVCAPGVEADRARLIELRLGLREERFDAELSLGKHAELTGELVATVAANPLRERLVGQLMLALYRGNRQADALHAYQELRERLDEQLGSHPSADLRALHRRILRGEEPALRPPESSQPEPGQPEPGQPASRRPDSRPAATSDDGQSPETITGRRRPAQMPASVGHFTGRGAEMAALTAAMPEASEEPRVLVVCGAGGLGKTALVVRWGHAIADRFPDGQIFVELRGSSSAALTRGAALGSALLALGVTAEDLPVSAEERAALYRTLIHGRRILVVADDANAATQLLPLVPPTAGSQIVATSRSRLPELGAHHAVRTLTVEPFSAEPAVALLRKIVGPQRLGEDGARDVAEQCGGWPLALRLAGATLSARQAQPAESFAAELRQRAHGSAIAEDFQPVRDALADAHDSLDPAARRLFEQLGLLPGVTVCLQLAAAAAGISALRARRLLDELTAANLVMEVGVDRYGLHDLVRRYARSHGICLSDRAVIEERVMRWHLAVFDALARRVEPDGGWPIVVGEPRWSPLEDEADADRFVAEEDPNIPGAVRWAAARCGPKLAWQLFSLAHAAGAVVPVETAELGLACAQRIDDLRAVGEAHARLGTVLLRDPSRLADADTHLTLAAELLEPADGRLPSVVAFGLGLLRSREGRLGEARVAHERALRHFDPAREPLTYATVLLGYSEVLHLAGDVERAGQRLAQAAILAQAAVGTQGTSLGGFDALERDRARWEQRSVEEFLAHLSRVLDSPQITALDRGMARTVVDLSLALRLRESGTATVPSSTARGGRAPAPTA